MHNMGHDPSPRSIAATHTEISASTELVQSSAQDASDKDVAEARATLTAELETLKTSVQLKDEQIKTLKRQIANLQTQVEIESIRADIANLREMASKR